MFIKIRLCLIFPQVVNPSDQKNFGINIQKLNVSASMDSPAE